MRDVGWLVVPFWGLCAWACSASVGEAPEGSAGAQEVGQAGTGQGGRGSGEEAGAAGAPRSADAGATGEGLGGSAGGWPPADSLSLWYCPGAGPPGAAGAAGAIGFSDEVSWPLPDPAEATLSQLVGDWFHNGAPNNYGHVDSFRFNADGTASQATEMLYDTPDGSTLTYAGAVELADHTITLDSTAGTSDYFSYDFLAHELLSSHANLPDQVILYGYSYDAATDRLYVNTEFCNDPVPFVRIHP